MAFDKRDWTVPVPHGGVGCAYLLVTFLGVLFFFFAAFTCWLTVSQAHDFKVLVGYWSRESIEYAEASALEGRNRNYCVSWDSATRESLFDGPWKFGRTVGVIGAMICIPLFLVGLLILCFEFSPQTFTALACTNIAMAILSILLLSGLGSTVCEAEHCRIGAGGVCAIVDVFIWIIAAAIAFRMRMQSLAIHGTGGKTTPDKSNVIGRQEQAGHATAGSDRSSSETEAPEQARPASPPTKKKKKSKTKKAKLAEKEPSTGTVVEEP